ncbi:ArsR/SmtB family transcription factor [Thiomicrospira cyclica]|uniref:Transcriptional regulator, ArsR family n=1 Tax=Thiomicrospira cyclica (strain DSM 14477 / JCM 11371 / ALM1) TaxID=717773 RepID=F6D8Y8_THICA|nr:metalloregulator ArsR/SmtB family transcription factor [Thiomicrospira cyclica]AEG31988.1 transcriptional regulator, ArsR family [Thiomicrospira cyclica ALM1]
MANSLKYNLFDQLAQVSKALGHANRLMILDVLAQTESDVDTLHQKLGLSIANVSKHLQTLKQAGLVVNERQGQRVVYGLSDPSVFRLIVSLRDVAESQLDSMQSLLQSHLQPNTPFEPISLNALKDFNQPYTLLDVRPADEFAAGHIPQAINIPIEQLAQKLPELHSDKTLVVYCRGPYCMWSQQALDQLQQHGIQAKRLAEGYPEWQQLSHAL